MTDLTFEFERVHFTVSKSGDEVTGIARFPYLGAGGRTEIAINYRRAPVAAPLPTASDPATQRRLAAVELFRDLLTQTPDASKRWLYCQVAEKFFVSPSSVRGWVASFELDGVDGLKDRYTARPRSTVQLDPAVARDACIIVAWWAFRIGTGVNEITGPLINEAASLLTRAVPLLQRAHRPASTAILADVIAAIDCYFSAISDPVRFPFKPFSRWAKWDFEKWLLRGTRNDSSEGKQYVNDLHPNSLPTAPAGVKPVALQTTESVLPATVVDQRTRRREANWSQRRRGAASSSCQDQGKPSCPMQQTLAEWLHSQEDRTRNMLLAACRRNATPDVRSQVAATLPLWWDSVPDSTRHNIEFKLAAWYKNHPHATPQQLSKWKANLVVSAIRLEWQTRLPALGQLIDAIEGTMRT